MSDHLDKARTALEHAADLDVDLKSTEPLAPIYLRLLDLAAIQASLAQAAALEDIAIALRAQDRRRQQQASLRS